MYNLKTAVLLAGLLGLFLLLGQLVGGTQGLVVALVMGSLFNFVMYFFSDRIVLKMYGAQVVTAAEAPELVATIDRLRRRAGLPMPKVAIAHQTQPNAFATGRSPSHAVVAVTAGLLQAMPVGSEELEGVIAHELAHVKNRDMLITTVAAGVAAAISNLPYLLMFGGGDRDGDRNPMAELALLLLAPIGAMLIQMAVSRQREYEADRTGAEILGRPLPLANALRQLDALAHRIPMDVAPAAAPLAQVNPFSASQGGLANLFSTHPPMAERIARLEALAGVRAMATR
ncbi:MAG TPA: M48 family metalloprotease [Gemmatimonadales bacterium]|nr:M48 family metalloprotease [Gemmatimonadales bacterium]